MAINDVAGEWVYKMLFENFCVMSGFRTLKPKKPKNLKTFFSKKSTSIPALGCAHTLCLCDALLKLKLVFCFRLYKEHVICFW